METNSSSSENSLPATESLPLPEAVRQSFLAVENTIRQTGDGVRKLQVLVAGDTVTIRGVVSAPYMVEAVIGVARQHFDQKIGILNEIEVRRNDTNKA